MIAKAGASLPENRKSLKEFLCWLYLISGAHPKGFPLQFFLSLFFLLLLFFLSTQSFFDTGGPKVDMYSSVFLLSKRDYLLTNYTGSKTDNYRIYANTFTCTHDV